MNKREFLKDAILFFPAAATLQALAPDGRGEGGAREDAAGLRRDPALVRHGHRRRQVHRLQPLRRGLQGGERRAGRAVLLPHLDRALRDPPERRDDRRVHQHARGAAGAGGARGPDRRAHVLRARSSATSARTRPACRCARSARPSRRRTAWCWWTRSAASAAATASRPARTARATSTRRRGRPTSARSATTASPKGLLPACVEVCPTEARIFGDLKGKADRLVRFHRVNPISVLKPDLNTEPKVLLRPARRRSAMSGAIPAEPARAAEPPAEPGDRLHLPERSRDPLGDPDRGLPVPHGHRRRRLHPRLAGEGVQRGRGAADLPAGAAHGAGVHAGRGDAAAAAPRAPRARLRDLPHAAADVGDGDVRLRVPLVPARHPADRDLVRVPAAAGPDGAAGARPDEGRVRCPVAVLEGRQSRGAGLRPQGEQDHHDHRHSVRVPAPRLRRFHLRLGQGEPVVGQRAHADRVPDVGHRVGHRHGDVPLHPAQPAAQREARHALPRQGRVVPARRDHRRLRARGARLHPPHLPERGVDRHPRASWSRPGCSRAS